MKISRETRSVLIPSITVLLLLICSTLALNHGWKIERESLSGLFIKVGLAVQIIFLFFGAWFIYPFAFRGHSPARFRVAASFTPLFFWFAYQAVKYLPLYSVPETLYIIFNPVIIFFIIRTFFQIGLCELLCRLIFRRHPRDNRMPGTRAAFWATAGLSGMAVTLWFIAPFVVKYRNLYHILFS